MKRGFRYFAGRQFLLFGAYDWFPFESDNEKIAREAEAARRKWDMVRVIKDVRRFRAFIYVFGWKGQ